LLFIFYIFNIFHIFFSISPIYICQENFENFCGVSLYGLEIYQRILKNFEFFFPENRDITPVVGSQLM